VVADWNSGILEEVGHRPWPMPSRPWLMTQSWHDLLFAHWTVDTARLRAQVPESFELDLFEGQAWIGIVPFYMTNVSIRGVPSLPFVSEFPELNVRTYVCVGGKPGVYFFSLDAASALAVKAARVLLNLPYFTASMDVDRAGSRVRYVSSRPDSTAALIAEYEPSGPPSPPAGGSLEYFLTERYCLYHIDRRGRPYRLDIHHPPWRLQPATATFTRNTMADAASLRLSDREPLLHFSKRQDMAAWGT
jgi:uncharacterized protein YqjF (DUF2071 family)